MLYENLNNQNKININAYFFHRKLVNPQPQQTVSILFQNLVVRILSSDWYNFRWTYYYRAQHITNKSQDILLTTNKSEDKKLCSDLTKRTYLVLKNIKFS